MSRVRRANAARRGRIDADVFDSRAKVEALSPPCSGGHGLSLASSHSGTFSLARGRSKDSATRACGSSGGGGNIKSGSGGSCNSSDLSLGDRASDGLSSSSEYQYSLEYPISDISGKALITPRASTHTARTVGDRWSMVGGRRSVVGGRWSEDGGRRSEVGGRRSEVGGRWAEVNGLPTVASEPT